MLGKKYKVPMIAYELTDVPPAKPGKRYLFASYFLKTVDLTAHDWRNIVTIFDPSQYMKDDGQLAMDRLIPDLQKSIEMANESKFGKKCIAQVLFFR